MQAPKGVRPALGPPQVGVPDLKSDCYLKRYIMHAQVQGRSVPGNKCGWLSPWYWDRHQNEIIRLASSCIHHASFKNLWPVSNQHEWANLHTQQHSFSRDTLLHVLASRSSCLHHNRSHNYLERPIQKFDGRFLLYIALVTPHYKYKH